ncbi:hypothetical protein AGLY_008178 [Aphis glycines]|uniref:Uncharacterized protein n=1 Tax=Aphis glycines TaxID=307491 RepID=A0A6G0TNC5_APHGL|nr:hypothetical protein AGLY_008178 [Aphis glycines]
MSTWRLDVPWPINFLYCFKPSSVECLNNDLPPPPKCLLDMSRLKYLRVSSPILLDHVRCLFRDHNRWRIGVAINNRRHYGSVYHPQTLDAPHPQPFVHNSILVFHWTHLARANRVVNSHSVMTSLAFPVFVGQKSVILTPWRRDVVYSGVDLAHGHCLADSISNFSTLHHGFDVPWVTEVIWYDFWCSIRVGTCNLYVTSTVRPQ